MAFVGIDLGTTNSLIAMHRNGRTEVIKDRRGNELVFRFIKSFTI